MQRSFSLDGLFFYPPKNKGKRSTAKYPGKEKAASKEPVKRETIRVIKPRDKNTQEARIAHLEMEVELLRNFLILTEEK